MADRSSKVSHPTPDGAVDPAILLVDDDAVVRDLLSICLKRAGHEVVMAGNGKEGLDLILKSPESICLVVTDIDMPGMSGIEFAKQATDTGNGCPVLLMSGLPAPREAVGHGWKFLAKPFRVGTFLLLVESLIPEGRRQPRTTPHV